MTCLCIKVFMSKIDTQSYCNHTHPVTNAPQPINIQIPFLPIVRKLMTVAHTSHSHVSRRNANSSSVKEGAFDDDDIEQILLGQHVHSVNKTKVFAYNFKSTSPLTNKLKHGICTRNYIYRGNGIEFVWSALLCCAFGLVFDRQRNNERMK